MEVKSLARIITGYLRLYEIAGNISLQIEFL